MVGVEVLFGHHSERADGGERPAVLAIEFVNAVTINDQLALLAAWQVEVVHQGVARIVIVPVAVLIHARPFVIAIVLAVIARIVPSSVGHRALLCAQLAPVGLSVKDALAVSARGCSGKRRGAGACRRGDQRGVVWEPGSGPLRLPSGGSARVHDNGGARSRPRTAARFIRRLEHQKQCLKRPRRPRRESHVLSAAGSTLRSVVVFASGTASIPQRPFGCLGGRKMHLIGPRDSA